VGTLQEFIQGRHYARISSLSAINDETLFLSTSIDGLLMMWPLQFVLENNPELKPTTWDRKASRIKALMTPKVLRAQSTIIEKPKGNITCSAAESYQSASVGIVGRDDGTFSVTQAFILSEGDEKDFSFHLSHFLEGELSTFSCPPTVIPSNSGFTTLERRVKRPLTASSPPNWSQP